MKGQTENGRPSKQPKGHNLVEVQRDYLLRIIEEVPGRKALIVDDRAMKLVSLLVAQSELLQKEVYLVERLDEMSKEKDVGTLKTLVLCSPTPQNINTLAEELGGFALTTCYIYFTAPVEDRFLEQLAMKDSEGKIQSVKEINSGYFVVNRKTFVLHDTAQNELANEEELTEEFDMKAKLLTLCSSMRIMPLVAYSTGSQKCKNLAQILSAELDDNKKRLAGEFSQEPAMLMIVDRNRDRLTPLRLPWSYQAMVHEHLSYSNGRVIYGGLANKEISLAEAHDDFFSKVLFENFGKTIEHSTTLLKEAAMEQNEQKASLTSLKGLEYIAERLPEVKRKANLAQRHFEVVEYLSEIVKEHQLLDLSRLEGELIDSKLGVHTFDNLRKFLMSIEIRECDKLRMAALYLQRFPDDHTKLKIVLNDLEGFNIPKSVLDKLKQLFTKPQHSIGYEGSKVSGLEAFFHSVKTLIENNESHLNELAHSIQKLKLDSKTLTLVSGNSFSSPGHFKKPTTLVIFVVGGISLKEATDLQNLSDVDFQIIAGGTHLLNTRMYLNQLLGEARYKVGV